MNSGRGNDEAQTRANDRITRLQGAVPEMRSAFSEKAIYETIVERGVNALGFEVYGISVPDDGLFDERAEYNSAPFDVGRRFDRRQFTGSNESKR